MPSTGRVATVDEIVEQVHSLLATPAGQDRLERFNRLAGNVVAGLPTLRELRARLQQRVSMQFHVNVSSAKQARRGRVVLSARVKGIECGVVTVGLDGRRPFAPRNQRLFGSCGADAAKGCEWRDPAVQRFIKAAGAVSTSGRPEAAMESALILTMKGSGDVWRGTQQPVCLAGLPFQVPLPVTASGASVALGDGHIDVLARLDRGAKGLRVYELKRPDAGVSAVRGALAQAVVYLAALKQMLAQGKASESWWKLIGFQKQPVRRRRFEAFAVVADTAKNRDIMDETIQRLDAANSDGIVLDCLYCTLDEGRALRIQRR